MYIKRLKKGIGEKTQNLTNYSFFYYKKNNKKFLPLSQKKENKNDYIFFPFPKIIF